MTGITAHLGSAPTVLTALIQALAGRGGDADTWHTDGGQRHRAAPVPLGLGVRAVVPKIKSWNGVPIVIDGIVDANTLLARYTEHGARALLVGADPYAAALADPGQGTLVLARNGDGPPLYYATHDDTVLVASEPGALLEVGVPGTPDATVIRRFLDSGACDDTEATFHERIRRVLPGQVIAVTADGVEPVMVRPTPVRVLVSVSTALRTATRADKIGVRLAEGVAAAALLAETLGQTQNVVPVYSASYSPHTTGEEAYADRLLAPLADKVTHRSIPIGAEQLEHDIDAFLTDLGEPVPDPTGYLLWATARAAVGEVDVLVDPSGAHLLLTAGDRKPPNVTRHAATAYLTRVADRCAARFGVEVRTPYAEVASSGDTLRRELAGIARQAGLVGADQLRDPVQTQELILGLRGRIYAILLSQRFADRPWVDQKAVLAGFHAALGGRNRSDIDRYWRLYLVERWLRRVELAGTRSAGTERGALDPNPGRNLEADGWLRFPLRTDPISADSRLVEQVRWYVTEFLQQLVRNKAYRKVLTRPWYVVVAAKPVAVAQGRAQYLWEINPGLRARILTARGDGLRRSPWRTQLAIEAGGLSRVVCAGGLRVVGLRTLAYKVGGDAINAVSLPREDAVHPADVAVIPAPTDPDRVAADILGALRTFLPEECYSTLGGCAIVSGVDILGWAGSGEFPSAILEDDPLGSASEHTPMGVLVQP